MTKGLIALVIPFATLAIHTLVTRDRTPWTRIEFMRGLALFLLLAAPWFVVVSVRNPEFARFFFIHEHFERFLTTEHRRTGAWWYFLPLLAIGLLPWTGVFLWGIRRSWTEPVAAGSFAWPRSLPDLVRVRAGVLQHLGFEAAVIHPADLSCCGAGARGPA